MSSSMIIQYWYYRTMDHSIHWYYCCCCWLGVPSGHFENICTFSDILKMSWFWDFNFWNFIFDFLLQWSFNMGTTMDYSRHWYYCTILLHDRYLSRPTARYSSGPTAQTRVDPLYILEWTHCTILKLWKVYFQFSSSMIIQYYGSFYMWHIYTAWHI